MFILITNDILRAYTSQSKNYGTLNETVKLVNKNTEKNDNIICSSVCSLIFLNINKCIKAKSNCVIMFYSNTNVQQIKSSL